MYKRQPLHGAGCREVVIAAERAGTITACDALEIGRAAFVLGAGREHASQEVHPGVGLTVHKKVGERVGRGEPLVTLRVAERGVERAQELVRGAFSVSD